MQQPTPTALLTDPEQLAGFTERHGVRLAAVGDDPHAVIAIGHHPPVRAVRAFNAYLRRDLGWDVHTVRDLYDDPRHMGEALRTRWAAFTEDGRNWYVDWTAEVAGPSLVPVTVLDVEC